MLNATTPVLNVTTTTSDVSNTTSNASSNASTMIFYPTFIGAVFVAAYFMRKICQKCCSPNPNQILPIVEPRPLVLRDGIAGLSWGEDMTFTQLVDFATAEDGRRESVDELPRYEEPPAYCEVEHKGETANTEGEVASKEDSDEERAGEMV
ncbi:hypothetical protein BDV96DRAFT_636498 [Lophiotrema nucula]|uniref:Transmembrane protein n=1 Tax=Lophiotrema nucula TaxID=690887 RepID=A0A6A5YNE2_9PLEO|nr:hypothetical protein BDV96DRAFT_636498 [Lophiotrema nucula]